MSPSKNILCLLSLSLHPHSGKLRPHPTDVRAISFAHHLKKKLAPNHSAKIFYLHLINEKNEIDLGEYQQALSNYFAFQVSDIHYGLFNGSKLPLIEEFTIKNNIDYLLCGARAMGGFDSGLFPFDIAKSLNLNLLFNVLNLEVIDNQFICEQFLPAGMRRKLCLTNQAIIAVHSNCPLKIPYIYSRKKKGQFVEFIPQNENFTQKAGNLYPFDQWKKMEEKSIKTHLKLKQQQSAIERMNQFVNSSSSHSQTRLIEKEPIAQKVKEVLNVLHQFDLVQNPKQSKQKAELKKRNNG